MFEWVDKSFTLDGVFGVDQTQDKDRKTRTTKTLYPQLGLSERRSIVSSLYIDA
jgi:hypothetical protein